MNGEALAGRRFWCVLHFFFGKLLGWSTYIKEYKRDYPAALIPLKDKKCYVSNVCGIHLYFMCLYLTHIYFYIFYIYIYLYLTIYYIVLYFVSCFGCPFGRKADYKWNK